MTKLVRTRFAPSPTGYLHVGGIRTAMFAWLIARQNNGTFILRLEDTDKKREVSGAAEHLMQSLKALGLVYDEGPDKPGEYGPYRQSERLGNYKKWAQKLIDAGRAYADPYTSEEVQAFREQAQKEKRPFLYRTHRPATPPAWDGSQPLRFKSEPKAYQWHDEVMGDLQTGPEVIDDFIIIKSDGYPTYNFSHIVDDAEMRISHVIRSQEFIASVPNYLNLYEALNIQKPILATVPFVMGPDGKKKLSKRDGAKDVLDYIREGFLPEAMRSFLSTLGWNDGSEQEIFSTDELIKKFSLSRVGKSGAQFDERRLLWTNGHFIRELSLDELYSRVAEFWPAEAARFDDVYKKQVLGLIQERLKYFAEIPELTTFFFAEPETDLSLIETNKQLKRLDKGRLNELLKLSLAKLAKTSFDVNLIQTALNELLEETNEKPAVLFSLIRLATTWAPASPRLHESLAVLSKEVVLVRLEKAIAAL